MNTCLPEVWANTMQRRKGGLENIHTCGFSYVFLKVLADGLLLHRFVFRSLSSLLSQGPATRGCLLHHLWLQSAQNSLVERISEMKSKYLPRECHRWRERDRKGGAGDQEVCWKCVLKLFKKKMGNLFQNNFWRVATREKKSGRKEHQRESSRFTEKTSTGRDTAQRKKKWEERSEANGEMRRGRSDKRDETSRG